MQAYLNQGLMPAAEARRRQDYDSARQVLATQVAALAPAALQRLSELLALQVTVAKELYETASARNARQLWLIFALGAASGALAIVTTLWVTRRITRQLGAEPHELAAVANRIASGDLTLQARQHAVVEGSVMASMQALRQTLNHLVHAVRQGVDCVSTASGQIAQGNQDLSARTEAQASSLQQTAASMEELSSTVQSTASNVQSAQRQASEAMEVVQRTGEAMRGMVSTFAGIQQASRRIADIIGVIDGIAFQTNILALNAAVEAARAGEQGRGFAVVASEVRVLAQRSAAAAQEIKKLIDEAGRQVGEGAQLVADAGQRMQGIVGGVENVSHLMHEISAASQEQSVGIEQINQTVVQMDQATQQNAALVEEATAAARELQSQAGTLTEAVSVFRQQEPHEVSRAA